MDGKFVTFSFDDGVSQDARLIGILNKYGLKAAFNLNSGLLGTAAEVRKNERSATHIKVDPADIRTIYAGHEIAAHTLHHPDLTALPAAEVTRQVEEDRIALEALWGNPVTGLAYPGGRHNFNDKVAEAVRLTTGIKYARTIRNTNGFGIPDDFYRWDPTCHFLSRGINTLAAGFVTGGGPNAGFGIKLFYIWGHSYELDMYGAWGRFERFCQCISGLPGVAYATPAEVYRAACGIGKNYLTGTETERIKKISNI